MSAFIVSKKHIDAIVNTANLWDAEPRGMTPDDLGQMLSEENAVSVAYRYREFKPEIERYSWPPFSRVLTPVEALKAIHCYEYQSCEHPGWETSNAKRFCEEFKSKAISRLPGYNDAPWEIVD